MFSVFCLPVCSQRKGQWVHMQPLLMMHWTSLYRDPLSNMRSQCTGILQTWNLTVQRPPPTPATSPTSDIWWPRLDNDTSLYGDPLDMEPHCLGHPLPSPSNLLHWWHLVAKTGDIEPHSAGTTYQCWHLVATIGKRAERILLEC